MGNVYQKIIRLFISTFNCLVIVCRRKSFFSVRLSGILGCRTKCNRNKTAGTILFVSGDI